jgi:hypothetical protein
MPFSSLRLDRAVGLAAINRSILCRSLAVEKFCYLMMVAYLSTAMGGWVSPPNQKSVERADRRPYPLPHGDARD